MPRIRVEIDVPDGEFCMTEDDYCEKLTASGKCSAFCEQVTWITVNGSLNSYRLPQCIAAEVKEKP